MMQLTFMKRPPPTRRNDGGDDEGEYFSSGDDYDDDDGDYYSLQRSSAKIKLEFKNNKMSKSAFHFIIF